MCSGNKPRCPISSTGRSRGGRSGHRHCEHFGGELVGSEIWLNLFASAVSSRRDGEENRLRRAVRREQGLSSQRDVAWGGTFRNRPSSVYNVVFRRLHEQRETVHVDDERSGRDPNSDAQGQIIVGALISGVLAFLVIATVIGPLAGVGADAGAQPAGQLAQSVPILTYCALAVGAVCLSMSLIVPSLVAKQQRLAMAGGKSLAGQSPASTPAQRPEAVGTAPSGLCGVYLNQLIIGAPSTREPRFSQASRSPRKESNRSGRSTGAHRRSDRAVSNSQPSRALDRTATGKTPRRLAPGAICVLDLRSGRQIKAHAVRG